MRTSKSRRSVILSISDTGDSYDDAAVESCCSSLKNELVHHRRFEDQMGARHAGLESRESRKV